MPRLLHFRYVLVHSVYASLLNSKHSRHTARVKLFKTLPISLCIDFRPCNSLLQYR